MKIPISNKKDVKEIHSNLKRMGFRKVRNGTCEHDNWIVFNNGYWWGAISDTGLCMHKTINLNELKEM